MLIIGLTGGIGCGKTTVANMFADLGVPVVDTDIISRQLVEPGTTALGDIIQTFGTEFLSPKGELNRPALAAHIFEQPDRRKKLEAILHPAIRHEMERQLAQLTAPYAIAVIPLLIESAANPLIKRILLIDCMPAEQRQRIRQRDQRPEKEINDIIQAQASRQQRLDAADDIIKNSGDLSQLEAAVIKLHTEYLQIAQIKQN